MEVVAKVTVGFFAVGSVFVVILHECACASLILAFRFLLEP